MPSRVLVADDDRAIRESLARALELEGYDVATVADGVETLTRVRRDDFDALVVDVMMPGESGLEFTEALRKTSAVPILMLTARSEAPHRILGLEVGADDYVVKPFSVRELLLRIRALLRRAQRTESEPEMLRFGRLRVDREAHRAWVDEREVSLTALEFRLLYAFLSRKGRVQTRETLLSDVWGIDADVTTRTVDTHVKRLREKLGTAGDYIHTVRGVGYALRTPRA